MNLGFKAHSACHISWILIPITAMKHSIRTQMRRVRRNLTPEQQMQAAISLCYQFRSSPLFFSSKRIGLYLANDGEIDPGLLAQSLYEMNRRLTLPIIDPMGVNRLQFAIYKKDTKLFVNRFGIAEPSHQRVIAPISLDIVLLPLVAFDESGNRLGMGGGFYDRTFSFKRTSRTLGPKLIGLAHECQKAEKLQTESWDIPLDAVLTDQRYIQLESY